MILRRRFTTRSLHIHIFTTGPVVEVDEADSDVSDDEDTSADAVTSHLVSTDESSTALGKLTH